MPGFSHFLGNRTINFRMFECLVTCFLRVKILLLCRLQAVSKIHVPIYPCLIISEGSDRHSNEISTVRKHVIKYKHMRKLMLVFLGKFENRGIKIARVNSIRITKSMHLLKFCMVLGVCCDVDILKLTARVQSINSESLCTVLC